jgi:NAD(P)-dependent dehydrogenase (short-subunit alcohol dehydrogenase family)
MSTQRYNFELRSSKFVYDLPVSTKRLSSRVVAITGASAGIGRACAERLSGEGAAVVVSARRADRLDDLVAAITERGGRALAVAGDVTREADMKALVERAVAAFGRLDVMICNAGIGFHGGFEQTADETMRRLVDVNLLGTWYAAHAAHAAFLKQGSGHVIVVSSIAGRRGIGGNTAYSATKAAQIGFVEALRAEYAATPLRASIVYPVSTRTEFHDAIARNFGRAVKGLGPRQDPEVVARAIADCIVSPKAEVYPYRLAWLLAVLAVVAPAITDRVVQKYERRRRS